MSRYVGQDSAGRRLDAGYWVRCRGVDCFVLELLDGVSDRGYPAIRLANPTTGDVFDSDEVAVDVISTPALDITDTITYSSNASAFTISFWPFPYERDEVVRPDLADLLKVIGDITTEYRQRGGTASALVDVVRTAFERGAS